MEKEKAPARKTHSDSLARWVNPVWFKLLVVAVCIMLAWRMIFPTYSWHQKLTVRLGTPQGVVEGSSVVRVSWTRDLKLLPDMRGAHGEVRGEATVVTLPDGRYLFALLPSQYAASKVFVPELLPKDGLISRDSMIPIARAVTRHKGETRTLSPEQYPLLVAFDDINEPASVKRVDPNDLAATFGSGYSLQSITMTITDEPVAKGKVEEVLGWLNDYYDMHFDGNRIETIKATDRFANSLASGAFDTEKDQ